MRVRGFNNFARVKHASIFETVKLGESEGIDTSQPLPLQKLMSAPVIVVAEPSVSVVRPRSAAALPSARSCTAKVSAGA